MSPPNGSRKPWVWGRKNEEYIADFELVSKRTLTDATEYQLFRLHFLLGADWQLCTRRLGLNRGNFFHGVYRVEQKLGRAFRELRPFPLFPVSDYFENEKPSEGYSITGRDGRTKPALRLDS